MNVNPDMTRTRPVTNKFRKFSFKLHLKGVFFNFKTQPTARSQTTGACNHHLLLDGAEPDLRAELDGESLYETIQRVTQLYNSIELYKKYN